MTNYDTQLGERLARAGKVFHDLHLATARLDQAKASLPSDGALRQIANRIADVPHMYGVDSFLKIFDAIICHVGVAAREMDQAAGMIEREQRKAP